MWSRALLAAALPVLAGWCEVVTRRGDLPQLEGGGHVRGVNGGDVTMECRVLRLRGQVVSWVRARDLQILAHAGVVFTGDARVSASRHVDAHTLTLGALRPTDAGLYECQVNTEPKLSRVFNLTVLNDAARAPEVLVEVGDSGVVRGEAGGAATLQCTARGGGERGAVVTWWRGDEQVSAGGARGGVSLETEREGGEHVVSRLTLARLEGGDAGEYWCRAGGSRARIQLHVEESAAEAMQRDEDARGGVGRRAEGALALLPLLLLAA